MLTYLNVVIRAEAPSPMRRPGARGAARGDSSGEIRPDAHEGRVCPDEGPHHVVPVRRRNIRRGGGCAIPPRPKRLPHATASPVARCRATATAWAVPIWFLFSHVFHSPQRARIRAGARHLHPARSRPLGPYPAAGSSPRTVMPRRAGRVPQVQPRTWPHPRLADIFVCCDNESTQT